MRRARRVVAWAGNGLEIFLRKLATEFDAARCDEREACAKIADNLSEEMGVSKPLNVGARHVANTIRARGTS